VLPAGNGLKKMNSRIKETMNMTDTMKKTETCEFCGNEFTRICEPESYVKNTCFTCSFWLRKINLSAEDEARRVIVDGQHYRIGSVHSGPFRGFGGRKYMILFNDNRVVETSCLWHQGQIPEMFREWLPDNAIFLSIEAAPILTPSDSGIPF
jgi:hypothetical protein